MKYVTQIFKKRHLLYVAGLVFAGGALLINNIQSPATHAAGADRLYLSPASGTYTVGSTVSVAVRENSNTDQVNAVEADLSYPTSSLQFVSTSLSGTAFGVTAGNTGGSGSVSVALGSTSAVSGDKLIATVKFKVLASGSASIAVKSSSSVLSSTTNANVASSMTGAAFTLKAKATTPPPSKPPTGGGGTKTPPHISQPVGSASTSSHSSSSVSIAPKNNAKSVTVPNNSKVELNDQATVQTTPATSKSVKKVEYYLGNKLVATVTTAPYNYSVDTENLRNGSYTLTSKTYYTNGKVDAKNTALIVKNPFDWTQFKLQVRHYAWFIIIVAIIVVDLVWTLMRRRSNKWLTSSHINHTPTAPTVHVGMM